MPGERDEIVWRPDRSEVLADVLRQLGQPVPSTKGMNPKEQASRLRAEMERRIRIAKAALVDDMRSAMDAG